MTTYIYRFKNGKFEKGKDLDKSSSADSTSFVDIEGQNDNDGIITEDLANSIDWVKLTKKFDLEIIKDIVNTIGKTKRDRRILARAIYDAEMASGELYLIPYSVDRYLNDLYKDNDGYYKSLFDAVNYEKNEALNYDGILKHAIDVYMKTHQTTNNRKELSDLTIVKTIYLGDNSNSIDNNTLPDEFKTPEAEQLMQKLVKASLLTENWLPVNLSIAERGYLADEISCRLKIKSKWKVMGKLWNENSETLRQGKNKAIGQTKTGSFIDRLKNILD